MDVCWYDYSGCVWIDCVDPIKRRKVFTKGQLTRAVAMTHQYRPELVKCIPLTCEMSSYGCGTHNDTCGGQIECGEPALKGQGLDGSNCPAGQLCGIPQVNVVTSLSSHLYSSLRQSILLLLDCFLYLLSDIPFWQYGNTCAVGRRFYVYCLCRRL